MDPRIAWHPTELLSNAYSTWSNVWMIAQMNCTNNIIASSSLQSANTTASSNQQCSKSTQLYNVNSSNLKNAKFESSPALETSSHLEQSKRNSSGADNLHVYHIENLNQFDSDLINSSLNLNVTSQTILNGLKSRKQNKASTFGFNFPINQHSIDDPMSTPWMVFVKLDQIASATKSTSLAWVI